MMQRRPNATGRAEVLVIDDLAVSPDALLARAAEQDARLARELVARLPNPRLLEVVLSQAALAVEPGQRRVAGIDALAELSRAAVELMDVRGTSTAPDDALPLVTGWQLLTVASGGELVGATTSTPARPWHAALVAFADAPLLDGVERHVVAATADMRFVTARLRLEDGHEGPVVLGATVTDRLDDLGADTALAWGLWCALAGAVEHP